MSAPTPRTDAAWSASFEGKQLSAGQTAQALRDCSQQLERELATITVERDQLRDRLAAAQQREATAIASWDEERNRALREGKRVVEWRDRAERAEAALVAEREKAERYRLATLKLDAELAAERARLDWVFRNCKVTADDYTTGNRDVYAIHDREDLGAAMKEGAK